MFKFDKDTIPYHISNLVFYLFLLVFFCFLYFFYLFALVFLGFLYCFVFLPPMVEGKTGGMFANLGFGEIVGIFFFLVVISIPLLVLYGAVYHVYKLITYNKSSKTAAE